MSLAIFVCVVVFFAMLFVIVFASLLVAEDVHRTEIEQAQGKPFDPRYSVWLRRWFEGEDDRNHGPMD